MNAFKNSYIMCGEEKGAAVDMRMWRVIWLLQHSIVTWYTWPGALTPYSTFWVLQCIASWISCLQNVTNILCLNIVDHMVFYSEKAPEIRFAQDSLFVLKSNGGDSLEQKLHVHSPWDTSHCLPTVVLILCKSVQPPTCIQPNFIFSAQTCNMYYKKRNDFLIGADIMRPGKAEAMRDMCNPKRFGKHIHMYYSHFPFFSVQLHMFIVHEDLRSSYHKDLFSPVTIKSRKFKINCLLVLKVETTLKHSNFLTAMLILAWF